MGVILKEEKSPLLGRDSSGGILGDNLGKGNCESKIVSRVGRQFLPRDIRMSRRVLGQNSAPNSGFGGAKSPVQKLIPDPLCAQ